MYLFYSALLAVILLLSLPYWLWESVRHGKYREGLQERLGRVPARLKEQTPARTIWIHAVSVGEVLAVSSLVSKVKESFPRNRVLVSTTTATGQKMAREKFGRDSVFYFPLDFAFAIRPYLRLLRPELIVLAETEFWPNFLRLSHRSGAKIVVVSGRISDRSIPGYRRFNFLLKNILRNIDLFLTQTEEDSRRLCEIGALAGRINVAGNLKFDIPPSAPPPFIEGFRRMLAENHADPVIVCGSTMEGEESLLLQTFETVLVSRPRSVMILAPRHPQRFGAVAALLRNLKIRFWLRSEWKGESFSGGVLLLDSIGELSSIYALADIAFVGGSLVPRGGHNIIEPAQHGVAIVVGNHMENFRDIVRLFENGKGVRVIGPAELPSVFMELLSSESERRAMGSRGAEILRSQMGATERTIEALKKLLSPATENI